MLKDYGKIVDFIGKYCVGSFCDDHLNDRLYTADPVFHLTHGFNNRKIEVDIKGHPFVNELDDRKIQITRSALAGSTQKLLVNPDFEDGACFARTILKIGLQTFYAPY